MKRDGIDFQAAAATVTEGESGQSGNKTRAPAKKTISHSPIKRGKPFEGGGGRGSGVKPSSDSPIKREKPVDVESGDEGSVKPIKREKPVEVESGSDSPIKREKPVEFESGDEGSVNDSLLSRLLEYKVIRLPRFPI
jgi:hypothetical protein